MACSSAAKGQEIPCIEGNADEASAEGAQEDAGGTVVDRSFVDGGDEALTTSCKTFSMGLLRPEARLYQK